MVSQYYSANRQTAEEFAAEFLRDNWLLRVAVFLRVFKMKAIPVQTRTVRRMELHFRLFGIRGINLWIRKNGKLIKKHICFRPLIQIRVPGSKEVRKEIEGA